MVPRRTEWWWSGTKYMVSVYFSSRTKHYRFALPWFGSKVPPSFIKSPSLPGLSPVCHTSWLLEIDPASSHFTLCVCACVPSRTALCNPTDCSLPQGPPTPCQDPLSIGFSKEEDWSGLPFPPPGDLPDPEIEPTCVSCIDRFFTAESSGESCFTHCLRPFV